jgi:hypothetical protein
MTRPGLLAAAAVIALAGASGGRAVGGVTVTSKDTALFRFGPGHQVLTTRLREPVGVIVLYRITAPYGVRIRGTTRLPGVTVPLRIATTRTGPSSSCKESGGEATCTVGEEWCPMPPGTWNLRFEKFAGPAADAAVVFRVARPPKS